MAKKNLVRNLALFSNFENFEMFDLFEVSLILIYASASVGCEITHTIACGKLQGTLVRKWKWKRQRMSRYCSENSFESWTTLRIAASELLSFPVSTAFSYTGAHTHVPTGTCLSGIFVLALSWCSWGTWKLCVVKRHLRNLASTRIEVMAPLQSSIVSGLDSGSVTEALWPEGKWHNLFKASVPSSVKGDSNNFSLLSCWEE